MRISDWSSDVCSSDLGHDGFYLGKIDHLLELTKILILLADKAAEHMMTSLTIRRGAAGEYTHAAQSKKRSRSHKGQDDGKNNGDDDGNGGEGGGDRKSVGWGKSVSGRVGSGGCRNI